MANTSWNDLLHSSSKLIEQAAPSTQFPPIYIHRDLEHLEALSMKLKEKALISTPFEDDATVEEHVQQVDDKENPRSISGISRLPRTNVTAESSRRGQLVGSPNVSAFLEKKAALYGEVVRNLNIAREDGSPFQAAAEFRRAYDSLADHGSMQKIWHLLDQMLFSNGTSRKMSLVIGARCHLEKVHEKYVLDTIQNHHLDNLQRIRAFLKIRLRDCGVLDFDGNHDARRKPPLDTTWQQVYFCLRTGYYNKALQVAQSSLVAQHFAPLLNEWIESEGMVSPNTIVAASEECENLLRTRQQYDINKLVLYAIISGSRRLIHRLLQEKSSFFTTMEDFMWFNLSAIRDSARAEGFSPYTLDALQTYLKKFEPSFYARKGKDPLVYPYVLLLSIQLLPAVQYLFKDLGEEGFKVDSVHICIALADHGVFFEGFSGVMDAYAEASCIIKHHGSTYLRNGDLSMALEYYAQAAAAMGGAGRGNNDQQRQKTFMMKQLMTEMLMHDSYEEKGQLTRFFMDKKQRQCYISGLDDKSNEIQKRLGAFSGALSTVNKRLSKTILSLASGKLDANGSTFEFIQSGNDILDALKNEDSEISPQERENVMEQQTVLRQLEAVLYVHKLARIGHYTDALREVGKLPFLPLHQKDLEFATFDDLSTHVQACIPDLIRVALHCYDNVEDSDTSLRALRTMIANFLASNLNKKWPEDLCDRKADHPLSSSCAAVPKNQIF